MPKKIVKKVAKKVVKTDVIKKIVTTAVTNLGAKLPKKVRNDFKYPRQETMKVRKKDGADMQTLTFRGNFDKSEVQKECQRISNELAKVQGDQKLTISVSLNHTGSENTKKKAPNKKGLFWSAAGATNVGDDVVLASDYDNDDLGDIVEFQVFIFQESMGKRQGGDDDELNDCLWNCLRQILKSMIRNCTEFKTAERMKKHFRLARDAKIPGEYIQNIEKILNCCRINVIGSYDYSSMRKDSIEINLILNNEHYELNPSGKERKTKYHNVEKLPLIIKHGSTNIAYGRFIQKAGDEVENNGIKYYISKPKEIEITTAQLNTWKQDDSPYVIIGWRTENHKIKEKGIKRIPSISEMYERWIKDADIIKKETEGVINLYKTGTNRITALDLFENALKQWNGDKPEKMRVAEQIWHQKTGIGSIMYATKYIGPCYKFDIVSAYASILKSKNFLIPMKEGDFEIMTKKEFDESKFFRYGIYRCIITPNCSDFKKVFRVNKENYYTNIDISLARENGFTIELIEDGKANCLIYNALQRIPGSRMFETYINYLFDLKNKGISRAKSLLNILAGALCQKDLVPLRHTTDDETIVRFSRRFHSACKQDDGTYLIRLSKSMKRYETDYARLGCFLWAKGREKISRIIRKVGISNVLYSHTDSIICIENPNVETGSSIGDLRYEGKSENAQIFHINKVEGVFKL